VDAAAAGLRGTWGRCQQDEGDRCATKHGQARDATGGWRPPRASATRSGSPTVRTGTWALQRSEVRKLTLCSEILRAVTRRRR
jgi:hypothetical protein